MKFKTSLWLSMFTLLLNVSPLQAQYDEKEPEIPPAVLEKMQKLQKGELDQLEKLKLADELQRAGAKGEALTLYQENLPMDKIQGQLPPEAYLNYGTALLEKGEEQKGLSVYESLASSLDPKAPGSQKIKEIIEKNVVNYFQVQEQKKQQEKQDKKDKKEKKDDKENQEGSSGSGQDDKKQEGKDSKDQKDKKDKGDKSDDKKDKKDKKDDKGDEKDKEKDQKDSEKDQQDKDPKDQNDSDKEGEKKKLPPPKMSPKLKQLMSDDRQLQLKVIEQGTRDMNSRKNRENKDW